MSTKIVIFGANGSLGTELRRVFPAAKAFSHSELDITDDAAVSCTLYEARPKIVINAAAYTNLEKAEIEPHSAYKVNEHALEKMVRNCNGQGIRIIHFSTDYVFDGKNEAGYVEDAPRHPLNIYGHSKYNGELVLEQLSGDFVLIRTCGLYGSGKSFPKKIIELAQKDSVVRVVNDQVCNPTSAADLADRVASMLDIPKGVYHVVNDGPCTWYEFAQEIVKQAGISCAVLPETTEEYMTRVNSRVTRPRHAVLLTTKVKPLRHWKEAIADYVKAL